jgi:hypothetical protein
MAGPASFALYIYTHRHTYTHTHRHTDTHALTHRLNHFMDRCRELELVPGVKVEDQPGDDTEG